MRIGNIAWPVLREMFIGVYDHMGLTILTSAVWLAIAVFPLFIAYTLAMALGPLGIISGVLLGAATFMPATAAVFAGVARVRQREETGVRLFFRDYGRYFRKGFTLGLINVGVGTILLVDLFFAGYTQNRFFQLLGGIWVWMGLFLFVMSIYYFPLMVKQENGVLAIMKKAALLTLDNPLNSFLVWLEALLVTLLCAVVAPLSVLALGGAQAFLGLAAFDRIMAKYDA